MSGVQLRFDFGQAYGSRIQPQKKGLGSGRAAAEFISVGPRIHHYGRDATRTSSGRGTGLFSKPTLTETATVHTRKPGHAVPKPTPG